jgi:hypothetical protein
MSGGRAGAQRRAEWTKGLECVAMKREDCNLGVK